MEGRGSQLIAGIALAAFIILTVAVAFLLSSQEEVLPTPLTSPTVEIPRSPSPNPSPTQTPTFTPLPPPSPTPTPYCMPPYRWSIYVVKPGDTLASIAFRYRTTVEALMHANCLTSSRLVQGQKLYVPPLPPTPTPVPIYPTVCIPPYGWRPYVVQPGDTLYSLAVRFGTTVQTIMRANCLNRYYLYTGEILYLPVPPSPTPTRRPTLTPTPIITPTLTLTPTLTPTTTLTPSPVPTLTLTPTGTPAPTPVPSPTPAETPTPTATPALSPTPIPSPTPSPVPETPEPTPTPSAKRPANEPGYNC